MGKISGTYQYQGEIAGTSIYTNSEEAPVFIFTDSNVTLFQRDFAYYSPKSSLGRYYGSHVTYQKENIKKADDASTMLSDLGVNISKMGQIEGYVLSEHSLSIFTMDNQIWVVQYHNDTPSIFALTKAPNLELQKIDLNLARDEDEKIVLVDTSAPQMLDIEKTSITKADVLSAIGVSNERSGILVVYQKRANDGYEEYTVFEFEKDILRSRAKYEFYDSDEIYEAAKGLAGIANGNCNDALRLLKTTYGYDVDLRIEFRGLNYQELKKTLIAYNYTVI